MSTDGRQFQPIYRISLFNEDGNGVTIEPEACIQFTCELDRIGQPNELNLILTNIDASHRANIVANEYGLVRLEAGYERANNMAIIFEGNIRRAPPNFRNGTDLTTRIIAGEGELAWRRTTIEHVFPTGTTFLEMARFCIREMPNITEGDLSGLEGNSIRSPYVVVGSVRRFFDDLATTANARWSMQRTSLDFTSNERARDAFEVTKKTFETGLYDADLDESALDAVIALDPALKPNGIIEIEGAREGVNGFWRLDSVRHVGSYGIGNAVWESQITGQRVKDSDRIIRQDERTSFSTRAA